MATVTEDGTKFWTAADLQGLQLLSATFVKHCFARHLHDTYVIGTHEKGAEEFYCRGALRISPVGSVITINPGEVHNGRAANDKPWAYRALYPDPSLLQDVALHCGVMMGELPYFHSPVVFDRQLAADLLLLHRILEASPEHLERQTAFCLTLGQLISRHAANGITNRPVGSESRAVKATQEFITDHYKDNLSLRQLADAVGLNSFYLVRVFSKAIGLPPHEYLTQVRVARAMNFCQAVCLS